MGTLQASELVLNSDNSVYHLKLKEEHIADRVIVVGDQGRVGDISKYFDKIEFQVQSREFVTHVGWFGQKRITVLSTGIGTDNIDIVLNELDAAVNIDLEKKELKSTLRSLKIVRIGTSGALQADIPVDSFVASAFAMGIDGTLNYYDRQPSALENEMREAFIKHTSMPLDVCSPYAVQGDAALLSQIGFDMQQGITMTSNGFYGPQGRVLRLPLRLPNFNDSLPGFRFQNHKITNYEMETSALFGLGKLLGHQCLTTCVIVANRFNKTFSKNYKIPMDQLIKTVLERI